MDGNQGCSVDADGHFHQCQDCLFGTDIIPDEMDDEEWVEEDYDHCRQCGLICREVAAGATCPRCGWPDND